MTEGPFTDDMARKFLQIAKMQQEIIPHMEEMAQKLAAAGVASHMVKGDSSAVAVTRWCEVIRKRARELLNEKMTEAKRVAETKQIEKKSE
jgi:hypothetical protein